MHLRKFDIARGDVPIGNVRAADPDDLPKPSPQPPSTNGSARPAATAVEVDIPEAEREAFELWLRNLWREKDKLMGRFLETGSLSAAAQRADGSAGVRVRVRLRHSYEVLDAFCFFVPAVVGWAWSKVRW